MHWREDLRRGGHPAGCAESRYTAGDPDRWCRRFGFICRVDRVYTGTQAQCLVRSAKQAKVAVQLGSDLTDLYAEVAEAAPRARIVVTGYPHLFAPTALVDPVIIGAINSAIDPQSDHRGSCQRCE